MLLVVRNYRMHCKEGRTLELSASVNVAPGFLSGYTKIVRFLPRYVIFNRLERPIRLWQDSSIFRPVGEDRSELSDARKWRFDFEEKYHHDKINQYESLYGRPAILGERLVDSIPEGTTAHRSALYISSLGPSELIPFHLPDSRGERQLRIDLGGSWNVTASFASDFPGEHALRVSRSVDHRKLNHVSTRAAPKYKIFLPPPDDVAGVGQWDGELGVYFETDWGGDRRIIVKGTKRGKYAFNHTDIHVGDELLRIDGVSVFNMPFAETMKLLKERLAIVKNQQEQEPPVKRGLRRLSLGFQSQRHATSGTSATDPVQLTLTFRTLEERLRKLGVKASGDTESAGTLRPVNRGSQRSLGADMHGSRRVTPETADRQIAEVDSISVSAEDIHVEMKSLNNTMFVILRPQDPENPPFRIQNRSISYIVFYRQRGCDGHPWNHLKPGESLPYSWEEPMKSKKLTVRIASNSVEMYKVDCQTSSQDSVSDIGDDVLPEMEGEARVDSEKRSVRAARLRQALAYQFVDTEERGGLGTSITVRLEEIGFRNFIPIPANDPSRKLSRRARYLNCEVDTDGGTRLLVISDDAVSEDEEDERGMLTKHLETLRKQISYEQQRTASLHSLRYVLSQPVDDVTPSSPPRHESVSESSGGNEAEELRDSVIEADAKKLVEDYPEETTISNRNQLVIQVVEAVGLNMSDFVGQCNPYCEVVLKGRSQSRKYFFQRRRNIRKTYYIENSLDPKWTDQIFVFDVPDEAVKVTRGHSIQIKLRNFRLVGGHPILGQAAVHFGSVRNQHELEGWYPLAGRTGRRDGETTPLSSDWGRGSIKIRVQWVYTTSALIDYFILISERRLTQLTRSRTGMNDQLAHAIESDQRKREARGQVNSGRIKKLAKWQRKQHQKAQPIQRATPKDAERDKNVVGKLTHGVEKLNQGINSSLIVLKDTLKSSRDRYLYALYFQTAESKRNRLEQKDRQGLAANEAPDGDLMNFNKMLPMIKEQKSPASGLTPPKKSLEDFFSSEESESPPYNSVRSPEKVAESRKSLDDFFSQPSRDEPLPTPEPGLGGPPLANDDAPGQRSRRRSSHTARRSLILHRSISHRQLCLDMDDLLPDEQPSDQWQPSLRQGQALYDGMHGQTADFGISDLISVNTGADEELKRRKKLVRRLMKEGFVFHEAGVFFHEDHLPHHFRRSLFASSMGDRKSTLRYRPKFVVGTPSLIRHFKSWQSAQALYNDLELELIRSDTDFLIRFKDKVSVAEDTDFGMPASKVVISERLSVPDVGPGVMIERARSHVDRMFLSRNKFERACRRTLQSVLNPGGWLTIRPITALNLPDTYTGMFVKLRYGSEVLVSETVDAKVTPRWTPPDFPDSVEDLRDLNSPRAKGRKTGPSDGKFKFNENDLHVHVEPQQTSGSVKISIIAERLNTKSEVGVLNIPLGAAIAACIDCAEDDLDSYPGNEQFEQPMYVRWFPLMSPRFAVPVEGDMGLSARPHESEKLRDNMFQQYFAPCIQLALIWWPDRKESSEKESVTEDSEQHSEQPSAALTVPGPTGKSNPTDAPVIENYFNADIGRISAALIDSQRAIELLSFSAIDIDVRYSVTKAKTRLGLVVGWIQLDHQDTRAREPVVLAPTPVEHLQPTLQILAVKDNLRTKSNIVSYEYLGVALQEMDLTVEESWIFELWDFFTGILKRQEAKKKTVKGQRRADTMRTNENFFSASCSEDLADGPSLLSILEGGGEGEPTALKTKIYVEQLILGLVKVNLSYIKGKKQSWELTDQGAKAIKNMEVKELPNLALAAGGIQLGTPSRGDQSEVFTRWSQHTYDEDLLDENGGKLQMR
jgi:hypothetical protein